MQILIKFQSRLLLRLRVWFRFSQKFLNRQESNSLFVVENDQGLASPPLRSISLPFTLFENRVVFLAWGIKRRPSFLLEFSCPPLFRARSFPIVAEAGLGARSGNCDSSLLTYPVIKPIFCTPVDCHRKDVRVCCGGFCLFVFIVYFQSHKCLATSSGLKLLTRHECWTLSS